MEKSNQIQIGLLAVIILMLGYMMFSGGFGSSSSSSASGLSDRDKARESLKTNPSVANTPAANTKTPEPPKPTGPPTTVSFTETEFDFGNITEGEKVTHIFKFKNTGKNPLIISDAKGSCGCTVPKWPKEPIAPGKEGQIEVKFDSSKKPGKQTKNVTITANTEPVKTILKISADVAKDPNAPATTTPTIKSAPSASPTITPANLGGK